MRILDRVCSTVICMPEADINTDQIVPGRFMHLPRVDYGRYCFYDQRFDALGVARSEHVLNQAWASGAEMLLAGPNFGCGSSREHAVFTLADFGFRVILAPSFGDIFYDNCFKNGVLPVRLPIAFAARLQEQIQMAQDTRLDLSLSQQTLKILDCDPLIFEIDPFHKKCLLLGQDELDLTLALQADITRFEAMRPLRLPHPTTFDHS